ncbi:hypothetical protein GCM10022284_64360 [Streptomyces hundungensis]
MKRPQLAEARHVRAVDLREESVSNMKVARAAGVCAESAGRLRRVWEQGGVAAACGDRAAAQGGRHTGRGGRAALEQSARAHGFEVDSWPLERVGAVVEREEGVVLSRASCGRC